MSKKVAFFDNFYWKVFFKSWLFCCLVYSFVIFQFWWGNHDWKPLAYGVKWDSGLFEARYSQHLFTVFFLDGHILPIIYVLLSLGFLTLTGLLVADYLCVPRNTKTYLFFILLLVCSPYTFVLFYYVFYAVPLTMWGAVLVLLMKLAEKPYKWWKFLIIALGIVFVLGGYPPCVAFAFIIFCGRKIILYQNGKQNIKQIISDGLFLGMSAILGIISYYLIIYFCLGYRSSNSQVYTVRINSLKEMINSVFQEFINFFESIVQVSQTLGLFYAIFVIILCVGAFLWIWHNVSNKIFMIIMICMIVLAARIAYIASPSASIASFRINYWSFTAVMAVALSILFGINIQLVKNLIFMSCVLSLCIFIRTDYEVQKTVFYKFRIERLFHKRVEERIVLHSNFNINGSYGTINFGYPDFVSHVCKDDCYNYRNEILSNTVLPADLGYVLFWDEIRNPISLKFGIWGHLFWRVFDPMLKNDWDVKKKDREQDINMWLYMQSKVYPYQQSLYVDEKYILLNLDEAFFYKNRGLLSAKLFWERK